MDPTTYNGAVVTAVRNVLGLTGGKGSVTWGAVSQTRGGLTADGRVRIDATGGRLLGFGKARLCVGRGGWTIEIIVLEAHKDA